MELELFVSSLCLECEVVNAENWLNLVLLVLLMYGLNSRIVAIKHAE